MGETTNLDWCNRQMSSIITVSFTHLSFDPRGSSCISIWRSMKVHRSREIVYVRLQVELQLTRIDRIETKHCFSRTCCYATKIQSCTLSLYQEEEVSLRLLKSWVLTGNLSRIEFMSILRGRCGTANISPGFKFNKLRRCSRVESWP